jgi:WD40 repeat protein
VSAGDDKRIRLWDPRTGKLIGEPFVGHTDWITAAALGRSMANRTLTDSKVCPSHLPVGKFAMSCDIAVRPLGASRSADLRPTSIPAYRNCPRSNTAHHPDFGHIPSVRDRFRNECELAPA